MVMNLHDAALIAAGLIGGAVAVRHGFLTQRLMVQPFQKLASPRIAVPIQRLAAGLLHFSTFNWFVGGLALILAGYALEREARLVTGVLVGSSYLFGALANLWTSRGWNPGWVLYGVALLLIGYGLGQPAG
jgi:hypothetical protein